MLFIMDETRLIFKLKYRSNFGEVGRTCEKLKNDKVNKVEK